MIEFMLLSIALIVVVMWLIVPALLGKQVQTIDSSKHINVSIARERLTELEAQLGRGEVSQEQYEQSRDEIESALLDDADVATATASDLPSSYKRNIFVLLSLIPFVAFGLYQHWGEPDAIGGTVQKQVAKNPHGKQQAKHPGSIEEMLASLEAKLAENPNDPNGWYMLARSYMVQKRYDKATNAYRTLRKLAGDQPEVLLGLADAMTMSRNGDMTGEPFALAKQALELAPNNATALWLTGIGYQNTGDLKTAITLWQKLLPMLEKEPESAAKVQGLIEQAQRQLGASAPQMPAATAGTGPSVDTSSQVGPGAEISVNVNLAPEMRSRVADTDFVMVYAQRVAGMKMPLAMVKAQVRDLPLKVTLNDSKALSPMNRLSSEQQVNVIARISKSGQAIRQPGDIEVKTGPYPVTGAKPVSITITQ